jgi:hypothetical protein
MADEKFSGPAIAAIGIGVVFVWGGIKGYSPLKAFQNLMTGQNPNTGQSTSLLAAPITATVTSGGININSAGLTNPIGKGLVRGRIDEGVDFTGSGPLYAMGNGTITEVIGSGWPGGIFINLKMDNGQDIYYAENITPMVVVGEKVKAGQQIGHANGFYPYIEIGFGTGSPQTAAASSHYSEGQVTSEGQEMASLLTSLGAP